MFEQRTLAQHGKKRLQGQGHLTNCPTKGQSKDSTDLAWQVGKDCQRSEELGQKDARAWMCGTTRERGGGAFGGGRGYHMHPGIRTGPLPRPILW